MSNRVTYRVTGDDWDAPDPGAGPRTGESGTSDGIATTSDPEVAVAGDAAAPTRASGTPDAEPPDLTLDLADEPGAEPPGARPLAAVAGAVRRLPPLHVGGRSVPSQAVVLAVAAIAVIGGMALIGGRPAASSAPTPAPTDAAGPAATARTCADAVPELPAPELRIAAPGSAVVELLGVPGTATAFREDSDWVAAFGPVESTLAPASTVSVPAADACIVEWRAVAAQPPGAAPAKWHPARKDQLELGWQKADREHWSPVIPLPPRGEWVIRLTLWYRTALLPPPASAAPGASPVAATVPPPSAAARTARLMVERYFHVVVGAPAGS